MSAGPLGRAREEARVREGTEGPGLLRIPPTSLCLLFAAAAAAPTPGQPGAFSA